MIGLLVDDQRPTAMCIDAGTGEMLRMWRERDNARWQESTRQSSVEAPLRAPAAPHENGRPV